MIITHELYPSIPNSPPAKWEKGVDKTHTHTRTQTLSADTHSLILDRPPARPTLDHLLLNIDERVLDNHSGVYVRARIVFEKPELG